MTQTAHAQRNRELQNYTTATTNNSDTLLICYLLYYCTALQAIHEGTAITDT